MTRAELSLGCDPELFIRGADGVVGSERVLGESPIVDTSGSVIVDGVQAELNPAPHTCRVIVMSRIRSLLLSLAERARGYDLDFSQSAEVSREEYESLSPGCKVFGCKPSYNVLGQKPITVDPSIYLTRTGGGHVHLGSEDRQVRAILKDPQVIIPVLDVVLGSTMVLLDRDPANAERRKNYGRAGEYREPSYGIEYRTLSNYWLRHPALASLVFGLARQAVDIVYSGQGGSIMDAVNYERVARGIDQNDMEIAQDTFNSIKGALVQFAGENEGARYPIDRNNVEQFERVVSGAQTIFPSDTKSILRAWGAWNGYGFNKFSLNI